jgi:predicted acylesterase/phospholipase RssA
MNREDSPKVQEAKRFLGGEEKTLRQLWKLVKALKKEWAFTFARRALERALAKRPLDEKSFENHAYPDAPLTENLFVQQRALCTYKDQDLPAAQRLDDAIKILDAIKNFGDTPEEKTETLGLYGAIYKRKWEVDSQRLNLERSLLYYRLGYEESKKTDQKADQGYNGINAAYLLDLLAHQEEAEKLDDRRLAAAGGSAQAPGATASLRRAEAKEIREDILAKVRALIPDPPGDYDWWKVATVAEAQFGLGRYAGAGEWLKRGPKLHEQLLKKGEDGIQPWEWETTVRQLASLARLQAGGSAEKVSEEARAVLREFIGEKFGKVSDADAALRSAFTGKVGLGLSGGGFRASLFHVGVLAKLAELDLLRRVEVLSCVSGGSIVGAHYYLEVRRLLESKPDGEVTREDFVGIVQRIERDFLAGVQRNIRSRIVAEWWTNVKLIFSRTYTRTNRAGELYERELFARVEDGGGADHRGRPKKRFINELEINPAPAGSAFNLKYDNWRRAAKVPVLVLNATTLNTGHNWQFTASWMGEPPARSAPPVDVSDRLRRMYYRQAPARYRRVRLGDAVAASACVPGLFEPLVLEGLYPDRTVRLVDGGVQDNQGITALLDQDCNVLLVSDASGQMASVRDVGEGLSDKILSKLLGTMLGGVVSVLLRTKDVLMARVRESEHDDLSARRRSSQLRGLMFLHLTKDLDTVPLDWLHCDDPSPAESKNRFTGYGILKEVQRLLASVRTDLDSFTDAEAYALMASGYLMAARELEVVKAIESVPAAPAAGPEPNWRFLAVKRRLSKSDDDPRSEYQAFVKQLKVAGSVAFKVWRLRRWLQACAAALALVALALASYGVYWILTTPAARDASPVTYGSMVKSFLGMLGTLLLTLVFGKTLMAVFEYKKTLTRALVHVGISIFGFLVARLHVHFFDRLYLKAGRVELRPHVLLCYAGGDERGVSELDAALRRLGCSTAVDGKDSLYSPKREDEIRRLVENSGAVLYIEGASAPAGTKKTLERIRGFARAGRLVKRTLPAGGRFNLDPAATADGVDFEKFDAASLETLLARLGVKDAANPPPVTPAAPAVAVV